MSQKVAPQFGLTTQLHLFCVEPASRRWRPALGAPTLSLAAGERSQRPDRFGPLCCACFAYECSRSARSLHERLHRSRYVVVFHKAPSQIIGDVFGDMARPALGGVEGDDAYGIAILACA